MACGDSLEVLAVTITIGQTRLQVYSVYSGPTADPAFDELLALAREEPVLIGGHIKGHHESWGSTRRNRTGRFIANPLAETPGIMCLNTGEPTHLEGGLLDLTLVSEWMGDGATRSLHHHLVSDYIATATTLPILPPVLPLRPTRWNIAKADWGKFTEKVTVFLTDSPRPDDLTLLNTALLPPSTLLRTLPSPSPDAQHTTTWTGGTAPKRLKRRTIGLIWPENLTDAPTPKKPDVC